MAGWVAGSIEPKAISALKLELKLELAGAELGNKQTPESFKLNNVIEIPENFHIGLDPRDYIKFLNTSLYTFDLQLYKVCQNRNRS